MNNRLSTAQVAVNPDSLSNIAQQTNSYLTDIETRLGNIIDRIQPSPRAVADEKTLEAGGLWTQVHKGKNASGRILEMVNNLETII